MSGYVQYTKVDPNEHWEGRLYPEWMLVKLGEADNTPGDPFDADWSEQYTNESKGEDNVIN